MTSTDTQDGYLFAEMQSYFSEELPSSAMSSEESDLFSLSQGQFAFRYPHCQPPFILTFAIST